MGLLRRQFTQEFKLAAVRRLEQGVSIAEVARGLEVNPNVLHRWRREFRQGPGNAFPGNGKQRWSEGRVAELERKVARTALRADDPILFLEHKRLYREPYNRSPHPGEEYTIPFGCAKVVKPGQSLTVITYGALVQKALLAATQIERRNPGLSIEILDLRTLSPYDWPAIRASVQK